MVTIVPFLAAASIDRAVRRGVSARVRFRRRETYCVIDDFQGFTSKA